MANAESGYNNYFALPVAPWDTTITLGTAPTTTSGRVYAKNEDQEEWIDYTGVSGATITGCTRGMSQTADPSTGWTWLTWIAWTPVVLVWMHDQLPMKTKSNTYSGTQTFIDIDFTGTTTPWMKAKSLTTAQRDAIATPANGHLIYNSTTGEFNVYQGWAWSAVASGSTQPNSSTTVAGKVETATSAEFIAKTDTGGTGANLLTLPSDIWKLVQSRVTAWENLTAWLRAYQDIDAKAYVGVRSTTTPAQVGSITGVDSTSSFKMVKMEYLTDNKAVMIYKKASNDLIYGTVVTFLRGVITVGTEQALTSSAANAWQWPDLAVLTSSLFAIVFRKNADDKPYVVCCTVSGTTITAGSETLVNNNTIEASSTPSICKVSSSTLAVIHHDATTDDAYLWIATVSGTTPTFWAAVAVSGAITAAAGSSMLVQYVADNIVLCVYDNWTNIFAVTASISGTTPTAWTPLDVGIAWVVREWDQLIQIDNGRFLLIQNQLATWVNRVITLNVPNTSTNSTPVAWSNYYLTNDTTTAFYLSCFSYIGDNKIAWVSWVTNGNDFRLRLLNVGYDSMTTYYDTTVAGTVWDIACCKLLTNQSKVLIAYRDTGSTNLNYSLYWNTENQAIGIVWTTTLAAASAPITRWGAETLSTTYTAWLPYYYADAGLIATSGTKQIGVTLTTTSLQLK